MGMLSVVSIIFVNASSVRVSERCSCRCLSASGIASKFYVFTQFLLANIAILMTKAKKGVINNPSSLPSSRPIPKAGEKNAATSD